MCNSFAAETRSIPITITFFTRTFSVFTSTIAKCVVNCTTTTPCFSGACATPCSMSPRPCTSIVFGYNFSFTNISSEPYQKDSWALGNVTLRNPTAECQTPWRCPLHSSEPLRCHILQRFLLKCPTKPRFFTKACSLPASVLVTCVLISRAAFISKERAEH